MSDVNSRIDEIVKGNDVVLRDLNSTNGTFMDGRRVERAYLTSGSQMRAGSSTLTFTPIDEEVTVEPDREGQLGGMVGTSMKMRQIFVLIKKIAPMDVSVIVQGETGGLGLKLDERKADSLPLERLAEEDVIDWLKDDAFAREVGAMTDQTAHRLLIALSARGRPSLAGARALG